MIFTWLREKIFTKINTYRRVGGREVCSPMSRRCRHRLFPNWLIYEKKIFLGFFFDYSHKFYGRWKISELPVWTWIIRKLRIIWSSSANRRLKIENIFLKQIICKQTGENIFTKQNGRQGQGLEIYLFFTLTRKWASPNLSKNHNYFFIFRNDGQ